MSRRAITNRSDRARRGYQSGYGHRATSNWGLGHQVSEYAEGDVVDIAVGATAFDGRIPHTWSSHPEECKPGLYRVVQVFSIGEDAEWYYRVSPIINGETMWDNHSDRLHVIPGECDYTEGWTLIESASPLPSVEESVRAQGYVEMPETDGGADFSLVSLDRHGKPSCTLHGAMNKVSPVFWRCVVTAGAKSNGCRAGCLHSPYFSGGMTPSDG